GGWGTYLVEDVQQQERHKRPDQTGGLDAAVAGDDAGHRAVVVAVVDQVQVAEDRVDDGRDREEHLAADDRRVDRVDAVADHGAGGDQGDHLVEEGQRVVLEDGGRRGALVE